MTTWDDLQDEQRTFIKRHFKARGVFDTLKKKRDTKANKAVIQAYGNYLDTKALFTTALDKIAVDYPQKKAFEATLATAEKLNAAGKFDRACQVLGPEIQNLTVFLDGIEAEAERIKAAVAPIGRDQFLPEDQPGIDQARQAVLGHLTDQYPSMTKTMDAFRANMAYDDAVLAARQKLGDIPAALGRLQAAERAAQAGLDAAAQFDAIPFQATAQHQAILDAMTAAQTLARDIQAVDRQSPRDMIELAAHLNAFVADDALARHEYDAMRAMIQASDARYAAVTATIQAAEQVDLTKYAGEPENGQLQTWQRELTADIAAITNWATQATAAELDARNLRIDAAAQRAKSLFDTLQVLDTRMLKADLAGKGVRDAFQDGVVALLETNPAAAEKVIATVTGNHAILNGVTPDKDFVRTQKTTVDGIKTTLKTLEREKDNAQQNKETHSATWNTANARILQLEAMQFTGPPPQALVDEYRAARQTRQTAYQDYQAADALVTSRDQLIAQQNIDLAREENVLNAATKQRALLDAITFGPLSPKSPTPIPEPLVENVVDLFSQNTDLAIQTCALVPTAKDPESMTQTALMLATQCDSGFAWTAPNETAPTTWGEERSADYARDLLNRTAYFGADFAAGATDAISRGVHFQLNDAMRAQTDYSAKNVAKIRATEVAGAMIKQNPSGTGVMLDLNDPAFNAILERQKFSGDGQYRSSPMLNEEMDNLKAFFDDPTDGTARKQQAETILNAVTIPASPGARKLLEQSVGIDPADFDDASKADEVKAKIQVAIMKAMVTPISQHDVGSCFATAPVRKIREDDPLAVMEMYSEIATKGTYTPKTGPAVLAISNVQATDDPLTRSLEYSVASAGGQMNYGRENKATVKSMFSASPASSAFSDLDATIGATKRAQIYPQLLVDINSSFSFIYDPIDGTTGKAADGKSAKGGMKLFANDTKQPITTETEFVNFIARTAKAAAQKAGLDATDAAEVETYVKSPTFIGKVIAKCGAGRKPWEVQAGGWDDQVSDALLGLGGKHKDSALVDKDPADSQQDRAIKVMKAIGALNSADKTVLRTEGIHAFNAVPPEGVFKKIAESSNPDQTIQAELIGPGQKIATTKMPAAKANMLYDKYMESIAASEYEKADRDLVEAAFADRPDTDMTPAELEAHIASKIDAMKTQKADRDANAWAAAQTTPPTPTELNDKKLETKAARDKEYTDRIAGAAALDLGAPQAVIADSNWGDESNHTMFVMAPNPLTGEVIMWQRAKIGTSFVPMEEKWLNTDWRLS